MTIKNRNISFLPGFFFLLILITGCQQRNLKDELDTPTTGRIKVSVDETFYPVMDGVLDTFHALYPYAEVTPSYTSETQCIRDLLEDSARLIVITRTLTPEEMKTFESKKLVPRVTKIAYDALAFIIHPENKDSILNIEHLEEIFSGKRKFWSDNKSEPANEIRVVFDNKNSGTARYIKEHLLAGKAFSTNTYALDSNEQVIDYVSKNKNAIGVIGVNWISDRDDPVAQKFLSQIKVVSVVAPEGSPGFGSAYRPFQAWIATKYYPFTREVYIVSREARSGLGTGFSAFVAGEKGQRIILKSGLMPATVPVRMQQFGPGYAE